MATLILARNNALPDVIAGQARRLREWLDGSWAVLYSNPEDFAPHPSTPQGFIAHLSGEFAHHNVKPISLASDLGVPPPSWLNHSGEDNSVVIVDADGADAPVIDLAERALSMKLARLDGPFVMILDANGCCRSTITYRPRRINRPRTVADILGVIEVLRGGANAASLAGQKSA